MEHRETISIEMDEVLPGLERKIFSSLNLPKGTKLIYTSKTKFLTFDIFRPE